MGLCWSKDQPLIITSNSSLNTKENPRWTPIPEVSQEVDPKNPFAGTEPEPLQI
jgi:hypothetical protein